MRANIPSYFRRDGILLVREKDFIKLKDLFDGKIDFSYSDRLGVFGALKRIKYKKSLLAAIFVSLVLLILSSCPVWDVRVEGNEKISDALIVEGLEEVGFKVGSLWSGIELSEVENNFLKNNPSVSWINLNRRGTVAYVTVIENEEAEEDNEPHREGFSNVVASCDTVIEEITVKRGRAVVKVGDTVKKGDLLISGIISDEQGTKYCYAEGTVLGRVGERITVETQRTYQQKKKVGESISSISANFFNFNINIFKKYGNQQEECDIIKDVRTYSLLGKCKLPFEIHVDRILKYESIECDYLDSELVNVSLKSLQRKMNERLRGKDLLRMRSGGGFTDTGYRIFCDAVYLCEVGESLNFDLE